MTTCPKCSKDFDDGYNMITIEAIDMCLVCADREFIEVVKA